MVMDWADSPVVGARSSWAPVVLAVFVTIPLALGLAAWLTRRRRRAGWGHDWAARSAWAEVFMAVGTLPWLCLTLLPSDQPRDANLVLFRDLTQQVQTGYAYATVQIGGNLLVFAALGFGMPVRWRVGPLAALVVGALGSTVIESLQWVLDLGRYSSVDDVLVNAAGATIAAVLSRPWWRRRIGPASTARPTASTARPSRHTHRTRARRYLSDLHRYVGLTLPGMHRYGRSGDEFCRRDRPRHRFGPASEPRERCPGGVRDVLHGG